MVVVDVQVGNEDVVNLRQRDAHGEDVLDAAGAAAAPMIFNMSRRSIVLERNADGVGDGVLAFLDPFLGFGVLVATRFRVGVQKRKGE